MYKTKEETGWKREMKKYISWGETNRNEIFKKYILVKHTCKIGKENLVQQVTTI